MNKDFPRIITLLREEKGLSQKQAASELGISQPLLSHYEKGIRECSLDFVVKTADYYNVTCDYLLGRTVIRNPYHDIEKTTPDNYDTIQASYTSNNKISPIVNYNKKTIVNSIGILFDLIDSLENIGLLHECCTLFFGTIYGIFRIIYSSNQKNPRGIFSVPDHIYIGKLHAMQCIAESNTESIAGGLPISEYKSLDRTKQAELSPESISDRYGTLSGSLFTLIQSAEKRMMK